MPAATAKLKDITAGAVPYTSTTDLVVLNIKSCGSRAHASKMRIIAGDAQILLRKTVAVGLLRPTTVQRAVVGPGLESVVRNEKKNEAW
jgi:hypothetical protein